MNKKRIPSLSSNYADLISENAYYVDKTPFIHNLESLNFKYLFFLRPRRFGKSLFLSMLQYYYGIQYKDQFESLFGEYFIGKPENQTKLRNFYQILRFDFSGISTQNSVQIRDSFNLRLNSGFREFYSNYGLLDEKILDNSEINLEPADYFLNLISFISSKNSGHKIYLIIDEYDHFTNELFAFDTNHFVDIVSGNGWVRKFYEVIKQFMGSGLIDRFFATGVTPVTLDSMTSGFNVARNISLSEDFNNLAGFTETEIRGLITNTLDEKANFDLDLIILDMRNWYHGSRFSPEGGDKLYNPQMVISFISDFSLKYTYPERMIDINVTSDFKKIANILRVLNKEDRDSIIDQVLSNETISEGLTIQYNFEKPFSKTDAVSLLFYNGLLSISDSFSGLLTYVIPNYVIKQLYCEYFRSLKETEDNFSFDIAEIGFSLKEMSLDGKIQRLVEYSQKVLNSISFRDLQNFNEKHLKMIFMTLLAGNSAYFVSSELETGPGYADIYLKRTKSNPGQFDHLIELKYIKAAELKSLEKTKTSGIKQITDYRDSLPGEIRSGLKSWLLLFHGKFEVVVVEV